MYSFLFVYETEGMVTEYKERKEGERVLPYIL
jgi:hypothetical protein